MIFVTFARWNYFVDVAKKKKTEIVEVVANCDNLVPESEIENMIFSIRGVQVMVDRDLAMLYGVETKVLNQAVKRNINRFPERFRFQLSQNETSELVTNCDRLRNLKHSAPSPGDISPAPCRHSGLDPLSPKRKGDSFWNILHRQNGISSRRLAEGLGKEMVRF